MHLVHIFNMYRVNTELGFSFTCVIRLTTLILGSCHFFKFCTNNLLLHGEKKILSKQLPGHNSSQLCLQQLFRADETSYFIPY
jgi:hypothetical protein